MSEYIMDLRKIVGHRPLLQAGASVLVEDEQGRLLLEQRADDGKWCYPGGSVELYENTEEAARRELFEETGITAKNLSLFGVYSGPEMTHVYPNGDETSNIDIVYITKDFTGELHPQASEVLALRFFGPDELPTPILETHYPCLNQWLESKGMPALTRVKSEE